MLIYFSRIADGGIDLGLGIREMAANPRATIAAAPAILSARILVSLALVVILSAIAFVALPYPDAAVLAAYSLTLIPVGASCRWIHLGLENTRVLAVVRALGEATTVLLLIALVRGPGDLLLAPLASFAGDALAAAILVWSVVRHGIRLAPTFDFGPIRPLLGRARSLVASALVGLLIFNSDLILLRFLVNREAVGLYAVAYTLITFFLNMGAAYSLSLLPTLTRTSSVPADHHRLYHTATAHVFALSLPVAIGGSLLARPIIELVFGAGYERSAAALAVLIWAIPLSLLRDVPVMALLAWGSERRIFRLTAWAAGLNIALNLVLIPRYGLLGAAAATVVTEAFRMVAALVAVREHGFELTPFSRLWKPLVAGTLMAAMVVVLASPAMWLAVAVGALGYILLLALMGGITITHGAFPSLNL